MHSQDSSQTKAMTESMAVGHWLQISRGCAGCMGCMDFMTFVGFVECMEDACLYTGFDKSFVVDGFILIVFSTSMFPALFC